MAKKKTTGTMSKSAAIRDYHGKNSAAKPKEISEVLSKAGYKVTPQYVSMILSNDRRKTGSATPRRKAKAAAPKSAPVGAKQISMDDLMSAKQLIQAAGGLSKARAALDAYAKLVDAGK